jgi:outer membrane protein assembly factor BamB
LLLLSSGFDSAVVYAIDPSGAKGDVTNTNVRWKERRGAPCTPSIVAVGNEAYWVSDNGVAVCADIESGKIHWSHRLGGNFSASPVAAEGRVYFQNETGVGFAVKAGKTFELLSENDLGERSLASYCVDDGTIFIRTENHLWRIGQK